MFPALARLCAFAFALLGTIPAHAVIFYSTADPQFNTNAPSGALTNSGWQWQGQFGYFLGTPIAPRYFITARHVGGLLGTPIIFQNVAYVTQAYYDDTNSDLRICQICGNFPTFAPLYTQGNEAGKSVVVFGRGTQRGAEVRVDGVLKGWQWGTLDSVQRWGENQVTGIADGGAEGEFLKMKFDAGAGPNEAHLSVGDSAGAVFIKDGTTWKLAGINYAVEGPYNTTNTGSGFSAAIFDVGGLYTGNGAGGWVFVPDSASNIPGAFYSTRISSRLAWINSVLNQTLPPDPPPTVESSASVEGPYTQNSLAVVDTMTQTIRLPRSEDRQFYRLRACGLLQVTEIRLEGAEVILHYQ